MKVLTRAFPKSILFLLLFVIFFLIHSEDASAISFWDRYTININLADKHGDTYLVGERATFSIEIRRGVLRFSLSRGFYYRYDYYNIPARNLRTTFPDYRTEVEITRTGTGRYRYRTPRLEEIGPQTLTVRIGIRTWLGFLTLARRSYTINVQGPPTIEITDPEDGSLFNTNTITVSGTVNDNEADVEVNEITADVSDYRFSAEVPLEEGENGITARATNPFGESEDSITVTIDTIPPSIRVTSPRNDSIVLETPITITGTTDDPDAVITVNGVPATNTAGSFRAEGVNLVLGENIITIRAVDTASNPNSISIVVIYDPDASPTELSESGFITGNVYHARTLSPLPEVSIRLNDIRGMVLTNDEGRYRFPINDFPEESPYAAEIVISKPGFTTCYRKAEVTSTRRTYVDPVYLTPIDPAVTTIRPDERRQQRHTSADGTVELIFPPGSVPREIEVTATNFQHSRELPEELPETTFFTYCVDLQPGVEFNEPVTLRVANELGFSPGTQIPIGIYNEETLRWEDTWGRGTVTPDGQWVEAQIQHFTPFDINFPPQELPPGSVNEQTSSVQNPDKEAIVPGCRISIKTGNFSIDHNLPDTRILGIPQSLTLTYSGSTANPNMLIDTEVYNDPLIITAPDKIKWELSVEGLHQERYFEGDINEIRIRYLYDCHNSDGGLLSTGRYSYSVDMSNVYANETYWTADSFGGPPILDTGVPLREPLLLTTRQEGHFIVNNQQNNPFGSGWGLSGLQRLYFNPDGSILLTDGNGSATIFNPYIFLCYVTAGDEVVVIDHNNSIIDTIGPLGVEIWAIDITPDGSRAYVANYTFDNVSVIDTDPASPTYNTVINTIGVGGGPSGIDITPDGSRAYVANMSNDVSVIDTDPTSPAYNTVIDTIGVGGASFGIAITPDGTRAYVNHWEWGSDNVSVIDTDPASPVYHTVIDTITSWVGDFHWGIAITPDGTRAYAATHNVSVIDTDPASSTYNTVIDTIVLGQRAFEIAITPDGTRAYVTNDMLSNVSAIDIDPASPAYNTVIDTIGVEWDPRDIAITPDGTRAYVVNHLSNDVSVIDTDPTSPAYNKVIDTINIVIDTIGGEVGAWGIAITPSIPGIFLPAVGESSYLIHNPDNTYTRFYKDGTRANFNENGLHTSTVDKNGNTITYAYDDQERLATATYPGDQAYTFQYNPATRKLSSITDPVGRVTQIQMDGEGNLVQITNPDSTVKQYAYDDSRLMTSTTNTIGQTYQFEYDEYGRLQRTIDPETTVIVDGIEQRIGPQKQFQPADVQHLINDLPPDIGTFDNPAPIVRPEDIQAVVTDPRDNIYTSKLDRFGAFLEYTDSISRTTQFTRDRNGNPTQIIRPNGTGINLTFDKKSNLTSYTENEIGATTTLTYNLDFSQVTSITDPLGNRTTLDYDEQGNPITITDALGNQTNITWDAQGKPLTSTSHLEGEDITTSFTYYTDTGNLRTITNPEGETTTITYDNAGNIIEIEDALGRITRYTYNLSNNRLTQIEDALGNITQYDYDTTGNVTQITDANANTIRFGYNELGQLISVTNPLGAVKRFWYDPAGNLVKIRDYNRDEITYVYDAVNRLIEKHWPSGEVTTYSYNNLDNLISLTNPSSELQFNYDPIGRLIQTTTLAGLHQPDTAINYTYDNNSNRLTLNEPALGTLTYTWDALNRLQQLQNFNGRITAFSHDSLSRRTNLNIPDILNTTYQYDNASRLLSVIASASEAISYNYTYNNVGNRTSLTEPLGVHNYEYDNIDQIIGATHPILPEENFTYDALGNRNPLTHTYNTANRLLEDPDYIYTYDTNGNILTKEDKDTGETTTYHYNVENQLTQVDLPDGTTVNYYYDGLGRRIEKNVAGGITRYIYDGMDVLAEFNGANELIRSYVNGPSIDEPLELTTGASTYYYISDGLGSITAIIDGSGNIVEQYRYDSFGNTTILNALGEEIPESAYANKYMFTAREYDAESGLYYYRARYYDPTIGRFLQTDPLGYWDSMNLYTYVNNNPVNWIDPFGLKVTVGFEEPEAPNPYGHVYIRKDQHVYDVDKGTGRIRYSDYSDVSSDTRGEYEVDVPMTKEQENKFFRDLVREGGREWTWLPWHQCADFVEDMLEEAGIGLPREFIDYPADTIQQLEEWIREQQEKDKNKCK